DLSSRSSLARVPIGIPSRASLLSPPSPPGECFPLFAARKTSRNNSVWILFTPLTQIPLDVAWDQSVPGAPSLDRLISRNAVSFFAAHCHVLAGAPGSASPQSRVRARDRRSAPLQRPPAPQ